MKITIAQSVWIQNHELCSASHLIEVSGLSVEEFEELVAVGVVQPVSLSAEPSSFQMSDLPTVMTASRLRNDFELDLHGLSLAMTLMQRIESLQTRLRLLTSE